MIDFYGHYFLISRRYICNKCEEEAKAAKVVNDAQEAARRAAEKSGGSIEIVQHLELPSYTFMAWDKGSIQRLPDGLGDNFPAFLTHRAAVDIKLLDFMRPLFQAGVRPEQFQDLLLELATKQHAQEWKKREHMIIREWRNQIRNENDAEGDVMFGEFGDKQTYCGYVPSAKYLASAYKKYANTLKCFFETEVKK